MLRLSAAKFVEAAPILNCLVGGCFEAIRRTRTRIGERELEAGLYFRRTRLKKREQ